MVLHAVVKDSLRGCVLVKLRHFLYAFGLFLVFLGVYFFPFGYDIAFFAVLKTIGHDDYWYTTFLFYVGCIAAILVGMLLIHRRSKK